MRLREEKFLMRLQIVSVLSILFSTIMIQVADYQVNKYNDYFIKESLRLFQTHQVRNDHKLNAEFYTIYQNLGFEIREIDKEVFDPNYRDPVVRELAIALTNNTISNKEFIGKFITHSKQKSESLLKRSTEILNNLKDKKPPKWVWMRNFIFVPLQFIGMFILIWGYSNLQRLISERTKKKNKND